MDNNGSIINYGGGTSMVAPQVTAAAAMIRSINPGLSAGEIKNMLIARGLQNIDGIPAPVEFRGIVLAVDEAVKKTIIGVFPEAGGAQFPGLATVTIRSTRYEGFTVTVDGNMVGTEGCEGDALDGMYSFKVAGNQQHLIGTDHPQYWERWQYFYDAEESYIHDFSS